MKGLFLSVVRIAVFLLLATFLTSFITSNTTMAVLALFPLPYVIEMPLYAIGLGMLFLGLMIGGMVVSTSHMARTVRTKKQTKKANKKAQAVENELQMLRVERDFYKKSTATTNVTLLPPAAK